MKQAFQVHRREFLSATAAGFAFGIRCPGNEHAEAGPLIDTHVYLGTWPLHRLAAEEPAALSSELRRHDASRSWAGSFDGLFHKDIDGVNRRLAESCRAAGGGWLLPFGSINPTLPDWEEDVRRCAERYGMPGIRLHPTYHGYKLDDPRFTRLLRLAAERSLMVQLVVHLTEEAGRHLTPRESVVELAPLVGVMTSLPGVPRLIVGGCSPGDASLAGLVRETQVVFDISAIESAQQMRAFAAVVPAKRMMFGSRTPLRGARPEVLHAAGFAPQELRAIRGANAKRLLRGS